MSIGSDSQSSSQHLSSSMSSLNQSSKKTSSEISKIYKHASQLFLTRRLVEAYESLQPIISPPSQTRPDDSPALAPIATATASQRIKTWSLYVTLLNSIVDIGDEEGRQLFGSREYREIVRRVRNGDIWEQVVKDGYQSREGSVDAEVVYNLSNLLLGQASDQKLNQSRLESYFSSSAHSELDLSTHLEHALSNGHQSGMNGTNTPKDLSSRIKILELFTLHVLPRNGEWDYAKSFISNSDILDEERREAFMQTLQELQDVTEKETIDEAEVEVFEDTEDELHSSRETAATPAGATLEAPSQSGNASKHQRTSSEVDYGIERAHPNGGHASPQLQQQPNTAISAAKTAKDAPLNKLPPTPLPPTSVTPPISSSTNRNHLSPPAAQTPRRAPVRKPKASSQNTMLAQARQLFRALSNLAGAMAGSISKNPTVTLRFLLFVFAFLVAFSQKQVRERTRRIVTQSWEKIRATVGMGVKVSYI